MRILPIHPVSEYNTGDLMTYYGAMYLMRKAYPDCEFLHMDINRAEREIDTYVPQYNWGNVDVILLCGSPFLSANPSGSKITMLKQARERFKNAKFLALGIGSSYRGINLFYDNYFDNLENVEQTNEKSIRSTRELLAGFDLVVTRDKYTNNLLDMTGLKSHHFYDTACFAPSILTTRRFNPFITSKSMIGYDKIFIYTNPLKHDMWSHFPEDIWKFYNDWMLQGSLKESKFKIITTTSGDAAYLSSIKVDNLFVTDLRYLALLYSKASRVISSRVHHAIYAKVCGCDDVSVIPFDCRYVSALNFGIDVMQPEIRLEDFKNHTNDSRLTPLLRGAHLFPDSYKGTLSFMRMKIKSYADEYANWIKGVLK